MNIFFRRIIFYAYIKRYTVYTVTVYIYRNFRDLMPLARSTGHTTETVGYPTDPTRPTAKTGAFEAPVCIAQSIEAQSEWHIVLPLFGQFCGFRLLSLPMAISHRVRVDSDPSPDEPVPI